MPPDRNQRRSRVGSEIQRVLATLIAREVKDPRIGNVTVTEVKVSPDLGEARVYFVPFAGAGSDAHVPDALGAAYVEMPDFDGPADFLAKLADAVVVGHHWDEPRPWTARIVPSTAASR